jgi:dephospho-CoA kinase
MLKLVKIAVTGGLACGKSSVCRFFKELGAYVISADEIVHQLLSPKTTLGQKVIKLIGSDIVINNQIDRSQIAKKVFNQPQLLKALEELIHPAVREEMENQYQRVKELQLASVFVAEIPLLYETGGERFFDYTVVVMADEGECQKRFEKSTGYGKDEYKKRMERQMSVTEKARRADYVIVNDGTLEEIKNNVLNIYQLVNRSQNLNESR